MSEVIPVVAARTRRCTQGVVLFVEVCNSSYARLPPHKKHATCRLADRLQPQKLMWKLNRRARSFSRMWTADSRSDVVVKGLNGYRRESCGFARTGYPLAWCVCVNCNCGILGLDTLRVPETVQPGA